METIGIIGYILGVTQGLYWENGKEDGNYRDYGVYTGGYIGFILGEWKGNGIHDWTSGSSQEWHQLFIAQMYSTLILVVI